MGTATVAEAAVISLASAIPACGRSGPGEIQVAEKPSFGKPRQAQERQAQTLSTGLQILSSVDPNCIFIVRRINKLGFMASKTLKQHFSAHGRVARVLVAHSTVRQQTDLQCHVRRRPSSLGFVHMASAEAVKKILAMGQMQEVDGVWIKVERFERPSGDLPLDDKCTEDREATACSEGEDDGAWDRQKTDSPCVSAQSDASLTSSAGASASLSDSDSASN